jgi:hypothetical protein
MAESRERALTDHVHHPRPTTKSGVVDCEYRSKTSHFQTFNTYWTL